MRDCGLAAFFCRKTSLLAAGSEIMIPGSCGCRKNERVIFCTSEMSHVTTLQCCNAATFETLTMLQYCNAENAATPDNAANTANTAGAEMPPCCKSI